MRLKSHGALDCSFHPIIPLNQVISFHNRLDSVELVFVRRSYGVKSYSNFMHSIVTKQSGQTSQIAFDMVKAGNGVRRQMLYLWCSFLYVLYLKVN